MDVKAHQRKKKKMSESKLFVGNLSWNTSENDLANAFGEFGSVGSAKIITDRETGRSRGFGFVEMGSSGEAQAAIEGLSGRELDGRAIQVNIARPRQDRGGGGGGGGGRW
jgi:RNA recognition motif-containing protein